MRESLIQNAFCRSTLCRWHRVAGIATALRSPMHAEAVTSLVLGLEGGRAHLEVADSPRLHSASAFTASAWLRADRLAGWQALMWKGGSARWQSSNREFGLFLNGGSVHLSSTKVSRQHRGHIYLDTPRGAVRTGSWHHVARIGE